MKNIHSFAHFLRKRSNFIAILLAILHFFLTTILKLDKLFFEYDDSFYHVGKVNSYSILPYYCAIKCLYFLFLIFSYSFASFIIHSVKNGRKMIKRGVEVFALYFFIEAAHILILFPGTWAWDDIGTVNTIKHYGVDAWQHIFTSILQTIFLQVIPHAVGIVIINSVIIAILVSYSVCVLEDCLNLPKISKSRILDTLIKCSVFFLPGVLTYQFSGYRMGLYVYIELALFALFISSYLKKQAWTLKKIFLAAIFSILVSEWRTEAMFFAPIFALLLFLQPNLERKLKLFGAFFILSGFFLTDFVQKTALRVMSKAQNYEVISTMTPVCELIRSSSGDDEAEIAELSRVLNLKAVFDNPSLSGTALYWLEDAHAVKEGYTKADYKAYLRAFFALSLKHPSVVFRERLDMFIKTSAFMGKTNITNLNSTHTALNYTESDAEMVQKFSLYAHNKPLFPRARSYLLRLWANGATYRVVFNPLIPMFFLAAAWVYCFLKKRLFFFILLTGEAIRTFLAFLTAPSAWFMYYLPEYLLGYTLLLYFLLRFLQQKIKK